MEFELTSFYCITIHNKRSLSAFASNKYGEKYTDGTFNTHIREMSVTYCLFTNQQNNLEKLIEKNYDASISQKLFRKKKRKEH